MSKQWDAIVIGSGFGGAVTACRLAEKNQKVLVLERGRRWDKSNYPSVTNSNWLWDQDRPEKLNGWIDLRVMDDMAVAQGAGVGGGSLIYASVSIEAKRQTFDTGWPAEITYDELKPHYDKVAQMLNVQTLPQNQLTERYQLMREAAARLKHGTRFRPVELAVCFGKNWKKENPDPYGNQHSENWVNEHGKEQGTCVHCGNCDIGCQVNAKNTLDLNYIARAESHGAEVRPLHVVYNLSKENGGYAVHFHRIANGRKIEGSETARRVILACGSLGSTELLFRARDEYRTLPDVSPFLGRNWSSNGDFLTPAIYRSETGFTPSPTQGPTITCAIDFLDGAVDGQQFFVEDGGFPNLLLNFLQSRGRGLGLRRRVIMKWLKNLVPVDDPVSCVMPWFGQAVDAGDGRLHLGRAWYAPWRRKLKLDWDVTRSEPAVSAMVKMHERLSAVTGGTPLVPVTWTALKNLVTPHPLGGCCMGTTRNNGVVDHKGEVFGYPGLYVADGAIVPRPIGLNPSRTIAALAERVAALMATNS